MFANCKSVTGTITITSNKNNSNGNQSLSITTTGIFADATHTDSVANGDKFCTKVVGGTFTELGCIGYLFDTSFNSGSSKATNWLGQGSQSSGNNGGGYFGGGVFASATESAAQIKMFSSGTISNIQVWETNGFQTFTGRINGSNTSVTVLASAGTWADDNTHSATYAINDLYSYGVNATSTERTYGEAMRFVSDDGGYEFSCGWTGGGNINVTSFACPSINAINGQLEADVKCPSQYQVKLTQLSMYIYAAGGTGTLRIRKGGSNGTGAVSWSTTIGTYRDAVSSDTFNTGDQLTFSAAPNSASNCGHTEVHVAPGVSTESATVGLAIANPTFSISASDTSFANKTATIAIANPTFSIAASRKETGAVTLAIQKMNFTVRGSREETGAVALAIANPQLQVFAIDLSALNPLRQFTVFG